MSAMPTRLIMMLLVAFLAWSPTALSAGEPATEEIRIDQEQDVPAPFAGADLAALQEAEQEAAASLDQQRAAGVTDSDEFWIGVGVAAGVILLLIILL